MGIILSLWTVLVLIVFLGIVIWAWSGKNKESFDTAARIPLDDDEPETGTVEVNKNG